MSLAEMAEIPSRASRDELNGDATSLQAVPSKCSIRFPPLPLPTAQTLLAEITFTAFRTPPPARAGLATTLHDEPFQCSIRGLKTGKPLATGTIVWPTAQTLIVDAADTPL